MSPSAFIACKKVLSLVWHDQADRCGVFTDSPAGSGGVVMGAWGRLGDLTSLGLYWTVSDSNWSCD